MPTCRKRGHTVQVNIVNVLLCKKLRELQETVLQPFLHTFPKSETITQQLGRRLKKLSQRIIKIWVFRDVMLCHRVSDVCFNRNVKTTNSVTKYHIPNGLNPQLQQCESLMTPKNIVMQPAFAEKCTI
jgi:hypothetical protein